MKSSLKVIISFLEKWGIRKPNKTKEFITLRKGELIDMLTKFAKEHDC